jgi:hypothetical protein
MGDEGLVAERAREIDAFAQELESSDLNPRVIVYYRFPDTEDWKLLVVPRESRFSEHEVYRHIAELLSSSRAKYPSLDVSDIRLVRDNDPLVQALSQVAHIDGLSRLTVQKSLIDDVYISEAVIYRLAL